MIDFKCNGGELSRAMFGGGVDDMCAEIAVQLGLIYGALKNRDEDAANEFKRNMILTIVDADVQKKVFSDELYKAVTSAGGGVVSVEVNGNEEFLKQLQELMKNESE